MKKKLTFGGLTMACFALMASQVKMMHDMLEDDHNIILTILLCTVYCATIAFSGFLGIIFWLAAFSTENTEETTEAEEGV